MANPIHTLADLFSELPGVGPRQARRIVQFLLRHERGFTKKLADGILSISEHVRACSSCFRFDDIRTGTLCGLCADGTRDASILLVVEKDIDVEGVEASDIFKGNYFVLGALMPLATQRKTKIAPRTEALLLRLMNDKNITEVILTFATTPEGDYTARELKKIILEKFSTLTVSLPARGLSLGAEIEYADQETLRSAFLGRR